MEKIYLKDLEELKKLTDKIPNSQMMVLAKISILIVLNMRYEKIMLNRHLETNPYKLVSDLIRDASVAIKEWEAISYIEDKNKPMAPVENTAKEKAHKQLFQKLWTNFSEEEYVQRIERFVCRLRINGLGNGWLKGFKCIDFGCGHGNFAHALIREGAQFVCGMDFGQNSIGYAIKARDRLEVSAEQLEFKLESVYDVSEENNIFDFAIQNGVFHHLDNEEKAYKEVWRVLKPGGWFWVYTDGSGAISHDLWDASVYILRDISQELILSHLDYLNIETGKRYHLGDNLNAVYRHETWDGITKRLSGLGFGNFRRLTGGFPTDFDHDVIAEDKYGREKFGEGDLRLLAQKLS